MPRPLSRLTAEKNINKCIKSYRPKLSGAARIRTTPAAATAPSHKEALVPSPILPSTESL